MIRSISDINLLLEGIFYVDNDDHWYCMHLCQEKYQFTTNIFDRIYILMSLFKET